MNFREQWYADRGLQYQPPKLGDMGGWRCVGSTIKTEPIIPTSRDEKINTETGEIINGN